MKELVESKLRPGAIAYTIDPDVFADGVWTPDEAESKEWASTLLRRGVLVSNRAQISEIRRRAQKHSRALQRVVPAMLARVESRKRGGSEKTLSPTCHLAPQSSGENRIAIRDWRVHFYAGGEDTLTYSPESDNSDESTRERTEYVASRLRELSNISKGDETELSIMDRYALYGDGLPGLSRLLRSMPEKTKLTIRCATPEGKQKCDRETRLRNVLDKLRKLGDHSSEIYVRDMPKKDLVKGGAFHARYISTQYGALALDNGLATFGLRTTTYVAWVDAIAVKRGNKLFDQKFWIGHQQEPKELPGIGKAKLRCFYFECLSQNTDG